MSTDGQHDSGDTVLDRIESILDVFETGESLTLTQVMERCDLPRATIHRSLQRLVRLRWLVRMGTKYQLGVRLFELGTVSVRTHWFHQISYPHLAELHGESNAVVHLGFLQGEDVLYWEKIGGAMSARVPTRIGDRRPAHRTAVGKALLAAMPNDYIDAIRPTGAAESTSDVGLRQMLARIRADGVAFDWEESLPGIGCIGAPTTAAYLPSGDVTIASVSVCAPIERIRSDRSLVPMVRRAAAEISRAAASLEL